MKKFLYVLSTACVFSFMVISWIVSLSILLEASIMGIFNSVFFLLPASVIMTILLFYLFYQDGRLFIKDKMPSSKSVISVSMTLFLLSVFLFLYPFLPGPNRIIKNNKAIIETLSIENVLNTDLVDTETQYNTSLYEQKQIGKIVYISSEYEINKDKMWLRSYDSTEKIISCQSSIKYIKNVPDLFYNVERSVFNSLTNTLKLQYGITEKNTVNGANSQIKYSIYSGDSALKHHHESEMQVIFILAENGDDFLLYQLAVCDDYDNLEINEEYILELVKNVFEHATN